MPLSSHHHIFIWWKVLLDQYYLYFLLVSSLRILVVRLLAQVRVRGLDRACSGSVTVRRWVSLPVDCHPPWVRCELPTNHPLVTSALQPPLVTSEVTYPPFSSDDKMTDCEGGGCATDLNSRFDSIFPTNFAAQCARQLFHWPCRY